MTCLVLCGRQTERESTAYWHIGDTQILHLLLKMAEKQMRLQFWYVQQAQTDWHFGFHQTHAGVQWKWQNCTPLEHVPSKWETWCVLSETSPVALPVKVRAVIGRQNRVSVWSQLVAAEPKRLIVDGGIGFGMKNVTWGKSMSPIALFSPSD